MRSPSPVEVEGSRGSLRAGHVTRASNCVARAAPSVLNSDLQTMAAKKNPKTAATTKPTSKAAFVRAYANLSAREIVAKAKEQGIKMGEPYVYNVRAYAKTKLGRRKGTRRGHAVTRPITTTSAAESLLTALAAEIGLARAIEILQGERARVHAVLRT